MSFNRNKSEILYKDLKTNKMLKPRIFQSSNWASSWFLLISLFFSFFLSWIAVSIRQIRPVPSWHHSLFGIRFYCCVLFIKYWFLESRYTSVLVPTYQMLFPFILYSLYSWCIVVVFIDNLWTRNEYANLVRYISKQRRPTRFLRLLRFPYQ